MKKIEADMSAAAEQDQVAGFKKYLRVLLRDKGYYMDIFKQMRATKHQVRKGSAGARER